ncbi:hypothetical protein D3C80_1043680 [compost metagenome]
MVDRPQRRLLPRRPGALGAAADHGPVVRLCLGQCRSPGARPAFAVELEPPPAGGAQAAKGLWARQPAHALAEQPADSGLPARVHRHRRQARNHPLRGQCLACGASRRTRPVAVRRQRAGGDARRQCLPAHRPVAVPADLGALWVLLVPAGRQGPDAQLACGTGAEPAGVHHPGTEKAHGRAARSPCAQHLARQHPAPVPAQAPLVRWQGNRYRARADRLRCALWYCHVPRITE